MLLSLSKDYFGIFTQDTQGQWIAEDAAMFQHLMGRAVESGCSGCPAGFSASHMYPVYGY